MTTIVYDKEKRQIAVDGRYTANGVITADDAIKYKIVSDGEAWIFAGQSCVYDYVVSIFSDGGLKFGVENIPKAAAFYIKDGVVSVRAVDEDGMAYTEHCTHNEALGSGSVFALAALDFGADAKEAVEYASMKDVYTGGRITVFNVDTLEKEYFNEGLK